MATSTRAVTFVATDEGQKLLASIEVQLPGIDELFPYYTVSNSVPAVLNGDLGPDLHVNSSPIAFLSKEVMVTDDPFRIYIGSYIPFKNVL